ncbi:hypothetical protein KIPB_012836, partial [Kipferlia bialata]|eukprot:g12836.t1
MVTKESTESWVHLLAPSVDDLPDHGSTHLLARLRAELYRPASAQE